MPKRKGMPLEMAERKVAGMSYDAVQAVLRSHRVELWLDNESIVRRLLAEKMERGEIADPTRTDDTVVRS
jgi:hypothetical protein